jgi:hypothetical protein
VAHVPIYEKHMSQIFYFWITISLSTLMKPD